MSKAVLIFLSARFRQYSNRLGDENVSSLTVSDYCNRRFKCGHTSSAIVRANLCLTNLPSAMVSGGLYALLGAVLAAVAYWRKVRIEEH
jgi:hypothetical protein